MLLIGSGNGILHDLPVQINASHGSDSAYDTDHVSFRVYEYLSV
jgi:hypothetical protein